MFFRFNIPNSPFREEPRPPQNNSPFSNLFGGFNDFMNSSFMHPFFGAHQSQSNQGNLLENQVPQESRPTYTRSGRRDQKKESPKKKHTVYKQTDAMYWKQKGNECFHKGDYTMAVNYYTKAISMNDTQSVFFSNRARCLKLLKRYDQALKDAQLAIELDQKNIKAHLVSGQLLAQIGKKQQSLKKIQNAVIRMTKALTLCSGQKKVEYQKQLNIYIYRAKKLLWYKQFEQVRNSRIKAVTQYKKYLQNDTRYKRQQIQSKLEEFLKSTNQSVVLQIPDYFCCRITFDLMEDPVVTDSGQTYQRAVIQEHIQKNGKTDPLTRQPITGKLYPNIALKKAIQAFIDQNPWAYQYTQNQDYNEIPF